MPIMTYGGFKRMTGFCKTKIPKDVADMLESIKDNEEAVRVRWNFVASMNSAMSTPVQS